MFTQPPLLVDTDEGDVKSTNIQSCNKKIKEILTMSLALLRRSVIRPQHSAWLGSVVVGRHVHETNTPELIAQRARRPLSPHLTIYQLQLTSAMSIGHRITGAGLATLIYGFGLYRSESTRLNSSH